jgi:hypothetical protein
MSDVYEKLKAPFPKEAHTADKTRGFELTSVKAQYVVERLNDVLGPENWTFEPYVTGAQFGDGGGGFVEGKAGVLFHGVLTVRFDKLMASRNVVGYALRESHKVPGDVYKSAMTDALSKAASHFGVANDVYKGQVNPDGTTKGTRKKPLPRKTKPKEEAPQAAGDVENIPAAEEEQKPAISETKKRNLVNNVLKGESQSE